jgi:hypothetical protein
MIAQEEDSAERESLLQALAYASSDDLISAALNLSLTPQLRLMDLPQLMLNLGARGGRSAGCFRLTTHSCNSLLTHETHYLLTQVSRVLQAHYSLMKLTIQSLLNTHSLRSAG